MSFYDLPAELFPFSMTAYRRSDDRQVWHTEVNEPGAVLIPPLAQTHGEVYLIVRYGDGSVIDTRHE